jgi:hypothetical protein
LFVQKAASAASNYLPWFLQFGDPQNSVWFLAVELTLRNRIRKRKTQQNVVSMRKRRK